MRLRLALAILLSIGFALLGVSTESSAALATAASTAGTDWTGYLADSKHSSYNAADTAITPAKVGQLTQKWKWVADAPTTPGQPWPGLFSSPTVANGSIYIGSNNGYFYQLDEATGSVKHRIFIGFRPHLTCVARGFVPTATVVPDPVTSELTVYIAGPDSYLYALSAADLSMKWRSVIDVPSNSVNDYFQWSSPTVANGKIYVGSASHCDKPLTRGAVIGFNQTTGREIARFYTVPPGVLGGGVWTSVAVDTAGRVYASTGTQPKNTTVRYDSVSIVKLDGTTLRKLGSFTVPDAELGGDGDFGGSPTIFGNHVGACNKNGIYYALHTDTMTLAWKRRIGAKSSSTDLAQCSAAAIYDGTSLYFAGDPTNIGGVSYRGSVRRIDPQTGTFLWETGLPNSVLGTPTMNGGGVIAVGTYDTATTTPNAVYLIKAATGRIIRTLNTGGHNFGQPVFANGYLLTTNTGKGLRAYRVP